MPIAYPGRSPDNSGRDAGAGKYGYAYQTYRRMMRRGADWRGSVNKNLSAETISLPNPVLCERPYH
jgi:hypothetical protein